MLQTGVHTTALWSRPGAILSPPLSPPADTGDADIALSGIGAQGPATGFIHTLGVSAYSATDGRYRLAANGFALCSADEERLCYNSDGTFRGQYLQGGDTYFSAPWHDPDAGNGSGDAAYLASNGGGAVQYAGEHSEADIFGGTGGGVIVTQTDPDGSFHNANNVKASGVVAGDLLRHHAIIAIPVAAEASQIGLRGSGNRAFAFDFDHDASGNITGFSESWKSYRAGYHDMGTINGKRWWYLWVDRMAGGGSAEQAVGINLRSLSADCTGRKVHVCELMVQKNPATPPAAVPVCAVAKTFAPDTLHTSYAGVGYSCIGLAMSRSQTPGGRIVAPDVSIGVPYEPIETRITIHDAIENDDRSGILHNENEALYNRPWQLPTDFEIFYGPTFMADGWLTQNDDNDTCTNLAVEPVFKSRKDLRPILGRQNTSRTFITGTLKADDCIFLGVGDPVTSYWQQTSIRGFGTSTSFALGAGTRVQARNCLVMGGTLDTTRARHERQQDDQPDQQVYTGEFFPQIGADGSIDLSGTRFDRMARLAVSGTTASVAVALNLSGTAFDYVWSDPIYYSIGAFDAPNLSNRFHARITLIPGMSMWQSRKEIEVDTGSGYVDFSASGLALSDLPHGFLARHVGTFDFDTSTFTAAPDAAKAVRIRYFAAASGVNTSRPGYEWQADQMDYGDHHRHPDQGDVFEVDDGKGTRLRVYFDKGHYANGLVWNAGPNPALLNTGTHADNEQVNRQNVTLTNAAVENVVFLNRGQGMFHTGDPSMPANGSDINGNTITGLVGLHDGAVNAHRFDHSSSANAMETLSNAVFIQGHSGYRYSDGSGIYMCIGAAGVNNTLVLGENVWIATSHTDGTGDTGGGTTTGTLKFIDLPRVSNYNQFDTPGQGDALLSDLLEPGTIHATGQANAVDDPWNFAFANTAAATLGFDPNTILTMVKGTHQLWDEVTAELAAVYFREPDHYTAISNSTAVGTVVASGITASGFHARYSGNGGGYFTLEGEEVKVAKALTGKDKIFVMRLADDQTLVVDVTT